MTDKEKLVALLREWDVPFEEAEGGTVLIVYEGTSPKTTGYTCFFTTFTFSPEGTFVSIGAWE